MFNFKKFFIYLFLILFVLLVAIFVYKFTLGDRKSTSTVVKNDSTTNTLKVEGSKVVEDAPVNETITGEKLSVEAKPLEWSSKFGPMNWTKAKAFCEDPVNGYTRLPTDKELLHGLKGQFVEVPATASGFLVFTTYWATEYPYSSDNAYCGSYAYGEASIAQDHKYNTKSVRCVR
jgi:hypothetical protein